MHPRDMECSEVYLTHIKLELHSSLRERELIPAADRIIEAATPLTEYDGIWIHEIAHCA